MHSFERLGYPFAQNTNSCERLGHPFAQNTNLFERLYYPFAQNTNSFKRLHYPFAGNSNLFKRVGHPFAGNTVLLDQKHDCNNYSGIGCIFSFTVFTSVVRDHFLCFINIVTFFDCVILLYLCLKPYNVVAITTTGRKFQMINSRVVLPFWRHVCFTREN